MSPIDKLIKGYEELWNRVFDHIANYPDLYEEGAKHCSVIEEVTDRYITVSGTEHWSYGGEEYHQYDIPIENIRNPEKAMEEMQWKKIK